MIGRPSARTGAGPAAARRVRPPAVAGTFYPSDWHELAMTIDRFLAQARQADADRPAGPARSSTGPSTGTSARAAAGAPPKALIVPHAGYVYSGRIAARAYARWQAAEPAVERVVLLGPAHRVPVRSMALSSADAWQTPLGLVDIDRTSCDLVAGLAGVVTDDRAHASEHSLEVHVPFLQRVLRPSFSLVPIVVGQASPTDVADVLDRLWGGDETCIVISTDLSHYHDYDEARELDRATAAAIVARAPRLDPRQACGAYPVQGMLETARRHDLPVELVDLRNSGDTAGPRDRVVGYGAFTVG